VALRARSVREARTAIGSRAPYNSSSPTTNTIDKVPTSRRTSPSMTEYRW